MSKKLVTGHRIRQQYEAAPQAIQDLYDMHRVKVSWQSKSAMMTIGVRKGLGVLGEDYRNDDEADDMQSVHGNGIHRVVEFQVHSSSASNAQS